MTADRPQVDAAAGALLGAALGDTLGAPFEGRRRVDSAEVSAVVDGDRPLTWTDDTHMLLVLAETLVADGGRIDPQRLGDAFAAAYRQEPWRGYGAGPPQVFALAASGLRYPEAARLLFDGGSYGNGAAMRCAPVAVVGVDDPAVTTRLAADQAVVTHAHPEGVDGAVLLAGVVRLALRTPPGTPLTLADLDLGAHALSTPVFEMALRQLHRPGLTADDLQGLAAGFGTSVVARESVPAAVAIAVATDVAGPLETIRAAVTLGGDTDTVACMAGAVAGAHHGAAALPEALVARLEDRDRLAALGGALREVAAR